MEKIKYFGQFVNELKSWDAAPFETEEIAKLESEGFTISGTDASIPDPDNADYTLSTIRKETPERWNVFAQSRGKDVIVDNLDTAIETAREFSKLPKINVTSRLSGVGISGI